MHGYGERTAVLVFRRIKQHLKKLGVKNGYKEVVGFVTVGDKGE